MQSTEITFDAFDEKFPDKGGVRTTYSFHPEGTEQSEMKFLLASYAFNGTFIGWSNLTTELILCGGDRHVKTFAQLLKFRQYGLPPSFVRCVNCAECRNLYKDFVQHRLKSIYPWR